MVQPQDCVKFKLHGTPPQLSQGAEKPISSILIPLCKDAPAVFKHVKLPRRDIEDFT